MRRACAVSPCPTDDYVVGAGIAEEGKQLLTVTELGYGKRTEIDRISCASARTAQRQSAAARRQGPEKLQPDREDRSGGRCGHRRKTDEDVMLVENGGVLIRMPVDSINIYKRDTQGVILMRVDEGSRVISIERVDREEEEPETPVEE